MFDANLLSLVNRFQEAQKRISFDKAFPNLPTVIAREDATPLAQLIAGKGEPKKQEDFERGCERADNSK